MTDSDPCVFIVDDDETIRASLSRALELRGFNTYTCESAKAFLEVYDVDQPGCLVLDYGMPDMSGLELQEILVDSGRDIPTIFITGHGGVPESVRAMKRGAIDFLEKPFRQEMLVERITEALRVDANNRKNREKFRDVHERFDRLTGREKEIAKLLVSKPSHTSSKEVGRELDISPRTVDHHRARILEKMNVNSVAELIELSLNAQLFDA